MVRETFSYRRFLHLLRAQPAKHLVRLWLGCGLGILPLPAVAQSIPIVEVAAPAINCLSHPECRITVSDSVGVLGEGPRSEFGFLQSRSAASAGGTPASGHTMMQYRLNLLGAEARRGGPCVLRVEIPGAPPTTPLDLDGNGQPERALFAVTRGALGTVVPSAARHENGVTTVEFADGVCPPGSSDAAADGQSSAFFGWFVRGDPEPGVSRIVLSDDTFIDVASRAIAREKAGLAELLVEPVLAQDAFSLPGFIEGQTRTTEVLRGEDGDIRRFARAEVVVSTDDPAELGAFLDRHGGELLRSFDPRDFGADGGPITYHVGIDPTMIEADPKAIPENLAILGYQGSESFAVSSEGAARLMALVIEESLRGLEIDLDWVFEYRQFRGGGTQEALNGPAGVLYSRNAYDWPTHSRGSPQDIGVGDAWTMLGRVGRLIPSVRIGAIDIGFAITDDQPWASIDSLDNIDPLRQNFGPGSPMDAFCDGASPCNHGANVASVFAGRPNNRVGAAGPAGPVASEIVYIGAAFNTVTSLLGGLQIAFEHDLDIVNMSFGYEGWEPFLWNRGLTERLSRFTGALERGGMLLVAAAGNDGDEETGGLFGLFSAPCQNEGVLCVGGLAFDSLDRHPSSDFGSGVEIYGPYVTFSSPANTDFIQLFRGTSAASPFVAGVAALVRAADASLDPAEVVDILIRTAKRRPDPTQAGLTNLIIDAHKAVATTLVESGVEPLTAEILRPDPGDRISAGNVSATLLADTFSLFDGLPEVTWSSDVEGALGRSSHIFREFGPQNITMTARDSRGNEVTETVRIEVIDMPPVVTIDRPADGQSFVRNDEIVLRGRARDPNRIGDPIFGDSMTWSLGDGTALGTGTTLTLPRNRLPAGMALLRLTGSDGALESSDEVRISIEPPSGDAPPTVRIGAPENGFSELANRQDSSGTWVLDLELRGSAEDPEDGTLSGSSLRWFATGPDNVRRDLGQGEAVRATLPVQQPFGTPYTIELQAIDGAGNARSDNIRVTVQMLS